MPDVDEHQIAYIAGVLDANAVICIADIEGTELPRIMVHGLSAEVLTVLAEATKTKVVTTRRDYKRHACTSHCPPEHHQSKVKSVSSRWSLTGAKATMVLAAALPYLHAKVEIAEQVVRLGLEARHKQGTVDKMVEQGWPVPEAWRT